VTFDESDPVFVVEYIPPRVRLWLQAGWLGTLIVGIVVGTVAIVSGPRELLFISAVFLFVGVGLSRNMLRLVDAVATDGRTVRWLRRATWTECRVQELTLSFSMRGTVTLTSDSGSVAVVAVGRPWREFLQFLAVSPAPSHFPLTALTEHPNGSFAGGELRRLPKWPS
jgi:hypothetical protein